MASNPAAYKTEITITVDGHQFLVERIEFGPSLKRGDTPFTGQEVFKWKMEGSSLQPPRITEGQVVNLAANIKPGNPSWVDVKMLEQGPSGMAAEMTIQEVIDWLSVFDKQRKVFMTKNKWFFVAAGEEKS